MVCSPGNVDEIELLLHVGGHTGRKTCEFFSYVLFEGGASPPAHFLYFSVLVPRQRQGICSATAEGVRVDAFDWDTFSGWVSEGGSSVLDAFADVTVGDIKSGAANEESREEDVVHKSVGADVPHSSCERPHWAVETFTISVLVYTNTLPPVLLIV